LSFELFILVTIDKDDQSAVSELHIHHSPTGNSGWTYSLPHPEKQTGIIGESAIVIFYEYGDYYILLRFYHHGDLHL